MIGNGFDLNCGLKTRYKDVYKEYCKTQSSNKLIQKFKEDINMDIQNWGDFEVAMCNYLPNFNSEKDFLMCLRDFKSFLNSYLMQIDNEFIILVKKTSRFVPVASELYHSINDFYKGITHTITNSIDSIINKNTKYNVITFNYTSAFEAIYNRSVMNLQMPVITFNHIHGILNDDVVLGMDSIEQIKDIKFTLSNKGKRAFIKPYFNEMYDADRMNLAKTVIENSNIICVFGMSLGISDYSWRTLLYKWLLNDKNRHLFIYEHSLSGIKTWSAEEKLDYEEDEKINLLQNIWQLPSGGIESIFDNVHIPCGKNIFNFTDAFIKSEKEAEEIRKSRPHLA